ncbi:MAG: hypothetical protein E7207_03485 [Clostridium butyricum]|nr:hypothetical protein [Clostridium butyricum]
MKKILICVLLVISAFSVQTFIAPAVTAQACSESYDWKQVWSCGEKEWVLYYGGKQMYGWHLVNGSWYYMYPSTGYMAHNTFVNGYYLDSNGVWTNNMPYPLQRILKVLPHPGWIYDCGTCFENEITFLPNQNLRNLTELGWDAPNVNGTVVSIDFNEFFVADDGTVFRAPHQSYDTILQYDEDGNVVNEYTYCEPNAVG